MPDVISESSVGCLIPSVAAAPYEVAPERRDDLKAFVDRLNIGIVFDDANRATLIHVNNDTNEIYFGVAFAERLWAYAYAYVYVVGKLPEIRLGEQFDFSADRDGDIARQLLIWAHNGQLRGRTASWPDHLPQPIPDPSSDPRLFEATEAFLCMAGFMLLHEIGHVVLGHVASRPRSYDESEHREYEADDWASDWFLSRWQQYSTNELVFVKRSLGAVFCLAILASFEVYDRTRGALTHPDPPERLLHFLDRFAPEGDSKSDPAWAAALTIVQIHLENCGRSIATREYDTFREALKAAQTALG